MINKIEKKIGKYAVKNLIYYVLGAYVIGYILYFLNDRLGWYNYIVLDPAMVMKGQVWRLFTWVCTVPQGLSIFIIFMFLLYFFIGRSLEANMGAFKYNLYMFGGWFFMTLGSMAIYWITSAISGPAGAINVSASTYYINLSSFLAFALLFPDVKVYFFGILPISVKVLAWIDVAYLALQVISNTISLLSYQSQGGQLVLETFGISSTDFFMMAITNVVTILLSLLNFLIFFIIYRKQRRKTKTQKNFNRQMHGFYTYSRDNFKNGGAQNNTSQQNGAQNNAQNSGTQNENTQNNGSQYGSVPFWGRQNTEAKKPATSKYNAGTMVHKCSICGRTNVTNPELSFRYCSKCEGNHEYCQDHLFTHEHVK